MVSAANAWHFCYMLPLLEGTVDLDNVDIVIPHTLQMGWCELPSLFCTATEIARGVIQTLALTNDQLPHHPLESYLTTHQHMKPSSTSKTSTQMEVYVDDLIAMTINLSEQNFKNWSRAILHGVYSIFLPPSVTGHLGGDPVSLKKLQKEEGQ